MPVTLLRIGSVRGKKPSYLAALEKEYSIRMAASGKQGLDALSEIPALIIVDAASMGTPGTRICNRIRMCLPRVPVVHVHPGPQKTVSTAADVLLFAPVGARRMTRVLERLLHGSEQDEEIDCGPFYMNVTRRILIVNGQETHLTPKQASLVAMFLRRPGEVIQRKRLMAEVWKTDYLGDTRTLDVHIRWIRQVIEEDSSKPMFLQTVRGVGYRLVVPEVSDMRHS